MPSRSLNDLTPALRPLCRRWQAACKAAGIDVLITCTWRSQAEQTALYAQGRTKPGKVVTWTLKSKHSVTLPDGTPDARAWDFVPLGGGKPVWSASHPAWTQAGKIAESLGLTWGGRWTGKRDLPHIQQG